MNLAVIIQSAMRQAMYENVINSTCVARSDLVEHGVDDAYLGRHLRPTHYGGERSLGVGHRALNRPRVASIVACNDTFVSGRVD